MPVPHIEESDGRDWVVDNHDDIVDDHDTYGGDHEPAQDGDLPRLRNHSTKEDQWDTQDVEEYLVDKVLRVDELVNPGWLHQDEGEHDEASRQE